MVSPAGCQCIWSPAQCVAGSVGLVSTGCLHLRVSGTLATYQSCVVSSESGARAPVTANPCAEHTQPFLLCSSIQS